MTTATKAIGYIRVSTEEQVNSGAGLAVQRRALEAEAAHRGWDLEIVVEDGLSAKDLRRPVLLAALTRLDKGEVQILVASKLDRLSRSIHDFSGLLIRAEKKRWALVCLDVAVDTTTAAGEFFANIMASAAQFERKLIGQRTREALAEKKAAGVILGRPQALSTELVRRIKDDRLAGMSLPKIAAALEIEGIATARGGARWYPSTVAAVLASQVALALA